jgi:hypothetical protein
MMAGRGFPWNTSNDDFMELDGRRVHKSPPLMYVLRQAISARPDSLASLLPLESAAAVASN